MSVPAHPLSVGTAIDPTVISGIRRASASAQVDFGLLVAEAQQESGLQADAKAPNSSATGLFQFIDSTWLAMVQRFGEKYGIGSLAQQISVNGAGQPRVSDPAVRRQILDLRRDPTLSAELAAEYNKINRSDVEHALGRKANDTDLYLAHFLGSAGASQFLRAVQQNGDRPAATLLPDAAAANPAVFYDKATGSPRTVSEIYRSFSERIEKGLDTVAALGGAGTEAATVAANGSAGSALPVFQRLVMGTTALTDPVRAMMDALAATALRLLRGTPATISSPNPLTAPPTESASRRRGSAST